MTDSPRQEIPRPKTGDDFEDLARALFSEEWDDPDAKRFGRSGQRQFGVDIYGDDRRHGTGLTGVQCKHHGSGTPIRDADLVAELRAEAKKAKDFRPALQRFLFATSASRSTTLDQAARDLTEQHRGERPFKVTVLGWEDIEDLLRRHSGVLDWYHRRSRAPELQIDLGRLPIPGKHFVGRDTELARLDAAWEDSRTHVLAFVAFGGVGKSALVARWLDRMAADGWRGAARVLDWSFYSQGATDQATSAEPFIDYALRFFGDPDPKAGSLTDRGARLAVLIRKEKSLLVLDGIEPMQYPHGRPEVAGRLKDPGLAALLKGLAAGNLGLCIVTTREPIADLDGFPSSAPQVSLEELEIDSAVEPLRQLGVDGKASKIPASEKEFQRHVPHQSLLKTPTTWLRRLDALPAGWAWGLGIAAGALAGALLAGVTPTWIGAVGVVLCLGGAAALAASAEPVAIPDGVASLPPLETAPAKSAPPLVDLVPIPGGTFRMGSPDDEVDRNFDEGPIHEVRISSFECMRVPVTRQTYARVMRVGAGWWPEGPADGRPVNNVTWFDAVQFCNRLSVREGIRPCYSIDGDEISWEVTADGYRLLTEAEWEYACRAGSKTRWSFGDDESLLNEYAWFAYNSGEEPQPVGTRKPNSLGLHDMHGNVWEWCWDWFGSYLQRSEVDPIGPQDGNRRVLRGGSAVNLTNRNLRSAFRFRGEPSDRSKTVGFRCARGPRRPLKP